MKAWLKGGLISAISLSILLLIYLIIVKSDGDIHSTRSAIGIISMIIPPGGYFITAFGHVNPDYGIYLATFINAFFYGFIPGAIIGGIVGAITTSRKNNINN